MNVFRVVIFWCIIIVAQTRAYAELSVMDALLKEEPTLDDFQICWGGGCAQTAHVALNPEEWQSVLEVFDPSPETAEEERFAIALVIAEFERMVGQKTGTELDRAGTFGHWHDTGQMDCNDESTNTTTYLKLLKRAHLLQFHAISDTKTRNYFLNGWPHTSAVIQENATSSFFAVDSWFYDNGFPAEVVPLSVWLEGWKPSQSLAY